VVSNATRPTLRLPGAAELLDRLAVRRAGRLAAAPPLPVLPEPQGIGDFARGRQIAAGRIRLGGEVIALAGRSLWDAAVTPAAAAEAQRFAWLDDLAALGDPAARALAQAWTGDWIARHGRGQVRGAPTGPAPRQPWTVAATAPRLLRMIDHAELLTRGRDPAPLALVIARQALFLSRRAEAAPAGPPRLAARIALARAALLMPALGLAPPLDAIARDCDTTFGPDGEIASRNPEHLLDLFTLLLGIARALSESDLSPPDPMLAAIARVAPTLRALRHADGGLPRLHGGDRGLEGRLDTALAASGIRARAQTPLHMGFARLSAGRTTIILDAAPPPAGPHAQASTLAFELTSGRRPLIVSSGPGDAFGPDWHRAARATLSQSTLCLDGHSSSRLPLGADSFSDMPRRVICEQTPLTRGLRVETAHDGWTRSHGLTHARTLELSRDGRTLAGEDLLTTLGDADRATFDRATGGRGAGFSLRFHLHPDVAPIPEAGALALVLRSGEVWLFQHDGTARLSLEPSVHLDPARLRPRPSQQVVLSATAMSYSTSVRWTLAKAGDTPQGLRDLARDEDETEDQDP
jgi:uncharacterized heparinase superfamily protein